MEKVDGCVCGRMAQEKIPTPLHATHTLRPTHTHTHIRRHPYDVTPIDVGTHFLDALTRDGAGNGKRPARPGPVPVENF